MPRAAILLSSMMLATCVVACAAGSPGPSGEGSEAARSPEPPRQKKGGKAGDVNVEQLISEAPGQGPKRPQALLARSASALSRATGVRVPNTGEGTYLAVFWGQKPTGGYSIGVRSVRTEGNRVVIRLSLEEPPPDAILTQALTYPYAAAVVREQDLAGRKIVLEDQGRRRLDWPVRSLGAGG
jgi:hypothetical protein